MACRTTRPAIAVGQRGVVGGVLRRLRARRHQGDSRAIDDRELRPVCIFMRWPPDRERTLMADMQVIVRLQDRGALRLDLLHDQALCEPEGRGDLLITHIMPLGVYGELAHVLKVACGQAYHAFAPGAHALVPVKVRPRQAADHAAAREFSARHSSLRVARLGEPTHPWIIRRLSRWPPPGNCWACSPTCRGRTAAVRDPHPPRATSSGTGRELR